VEHEAHLWRIERTAMTCTGMSSFAASLTTPPQKTPPRLLVKKGM
jgi:hypothetical protein